MDAASVNAILLGLLIVLAALSGIGLLIFIHEFGHFIAAKISGVKVREAAIGFGPKIYKKQWGETLYSIGILPLGGFVKLAGMEPEDSIEAGEEDRAFDNQSLFKKVAIIGAGPLMNILIAVPIFAIIFMFGVQEQTTVVAGVSSGSAAHKAGIQKGDRLISIDGQKIDEWGDVSRAVAPKPNESVKIVVERDGKKLTKTATVGQRDRKKIEDNEEKTVKEGFLGIEGETRIKRYGPLQAFSMAVKMTIQTTGAIISIFAALFTGGIPASTLAEGSAGPVGVIYISSEMIRKGFTNFLWFLGIISPNLAIVNLLPLPPLDGSRVTFLIYERIRGKRISKERFVQLQTIGVALLVFLMVFLTAFDLNRILSRTFMKGF